MNRLLIFFFIFFLHITWSYTAFAQPANDNPCNATPLNYNANCNYTTFSNAAATNSVAPGPTCGNYFGQDVWFSLTVPASGSVRIDAIEGSITDGSMSVYTGTCNSLTTLACDDDNSPNGLMPMLSLTGLTPGSTIFIRFWQYNGGTGTFGLCATAPLPPTQQDCINAVPICNSQIVNPTSFSGTGNVPNEINTSSSCLATGERNDVWYTFTVASSGNLNFLITPFDPLDDYDFAVFNLTNANCSDIFTNPSLQVSCNYSATPGNTGANGGSGLNSQPALGSPLNALIPVVAGQTYVVNVSNFSSTANGFTIDFGNSSASIVDNVAPALSSINQPVSCSSGSLAINFSENILCATVQNGDFSLSGPGGPYTITGWASPNCTAGANYDNNYTITINPPITLPGNYSFCLTNNSGSVTDNCLNVASPSCLSFSIAAININPLFTVLTCNGSNNGTITVNASGGVAPLQYSINGGSTFQAGNAFTNLSANNYTVVVNGANGCTASTNVNITQPPAVSITSIFSNIAGCGTSNGAMAINATGGTPPLEYSINNGATFQPTNSFAGLITGTYVVVVKDANGCTATANASINNSAAPSIQNIIALNIDCFGSSTGTITINGIGGFPPFTYSINGGASFQNSNFFPNLPSGNYQIAIMGANGCVVNQSINVLQTTPIVIQNLNLTNPSCIGTNNGSFNISVSGGNPPYQYSINNGVSFQASSSFNNLPPGNYQIIVRDSRSCTQTITGTITNPSPIIINSVAATNSPCSGTNDGIISITASGGTPPLQYSINNGISFQSSGSFVNLSPGNYQIVVKDSAGCLSTSSQLITAPSALILVSAVPTNVTCVSANSGSILITANGGTAPLQYSINGGTTYQAGNSFTGLPANSYAAVVRDANGCTQTMNVNISTSSTINIVSATPTPLTCSNSMNGSIVIIANGGTPPLQYSINNGTTFQAGNTFNGLNPNTFLVIVRDASGCTATASVTVNAPPALNIVSATPTPLTCSNSMNGSIVITANGGTPPLQYSINNGTTFNAGNTFNGLNPNTFQIIVRDANGCTRSTSATVSAPPALNITSAVAAPLTCNNSMNGSIVISAIGGTAPVQYSINNGATYQASNTFNGLNANNYQIIVRDANGCTKSTSANVTAPSAINIVSATPTPLTCSNSANGSIVITANGGTAPLQYSINNGTTFQAGNTFNGLAASNYQIIVRDANGCTQATTSNVIAAATINIVSATPTPITCNNSSDGAIVITANGGTAPLQYSINNGATFQAGNTFNGLNANTYQIIVRDANGCTAATTSNVTAPTSVNIVSVVASSSACSGSSSGSIIITANGGTAPLQYSINNGTTFQAGGTFNGLNVNTYQIIVRDANGCTQVSSALISASTAINIVSATPTPLTCSNSANGSIAITTNGGTAPIQYSINNGASFQAGNIFNGLSGNSYQIIVKDVNGCADSTIVLVGAPSAINIASATPSALSCNNSSDGAIVISANGGTAPLQYSINNGTTFVAGNTFNGLNANTYQIIVRDANGCTQATSAAVTAPAAVNIVSATSTPLTCNNSSNGVIVITANGGVAPLQYSNNNGTTFVAGNTFSGLNANTYQIIVRDANGCTQSSSAIVTAPAAINIVSATPTPLTCNNSMNGNIVITANGGSAPLQYSINNGTSFVAGNTFNGLNANTYQIIVRDANGCTQSSSAIVTAPAAINIVSTTSTPLTCSNSMNGNIVITANGGAAPLQYSINNGTTFQAGNTFNGLNANTYQIIVRDANGCTQSSSATVTAPAAVNIVSATTTPLTCNNSSNGVIVITANGGAAPLQYSNNNGATFQAGNTFNGLNANTYQIIVRDANGCTQSSSAIVTAPAAINIVSATPTPLTCNNSSNGVIVITANGGVAPLQYSNNNGVSFQAGNTFNGLNPNTFQIIVRDANGCTQSSSAIVTAPAAINIVSATSTPLTCSNSMNGNIVITANGGAAPLQYSINNGTTFVAGNTFNGLNANTYQIIVRDANGCTQSSSAIVTAPAAINIVSATSTPLTCSNSMNGNIVITANGGAAPLQYSINNGTTFQAGNTFNGLNANTYQIIVRDANGCTRSASAIVTAPAAVNIVSATTTPLTCNNSSNGVIVITANGGAAPLQYSNNNGATFQAGNTFNGLNANTYQIIVRDVNGCTQSSSAIVTAPAAVNIVSATPTPLTCSNSMNGNVVITANGGSAPLQYSINNGTSFQAGNTFNGLNANTYQIIVRDVNGCTQSSSAIVTAPAVINIVSATPTPLTCSNSMNGNIVITANGGAAPLQYSINNGTTFVAGNTFNGLNANTYQIIVRDVNGCTQATSAAVTAPAAINILSATTTPLTCNNSSNGVIVITANGGAAPLQYSNNNGTSFQAGNTFNGLNANTYQIIVRDVNGCTQSSSAIVTAPAAINIVSATATPLTCSNSMNGNIVITANGGSAPLQYSINNGTTFQAGNTFNGINANTYQIIVRDVNGCTRSSSAIVTAPAAINIVSATTTPLTCNNSSNGVIVITANGGVAPLQYSSNNGASFQAGNTFNGLNANTYQIIVRDANGCTRSASAIVTAPAAINIVSATTTPLTCNNSSNGAIVITANGGAAPLQYSNNNGASFQAGNTFNGLNANTYQIIVRDVNGCTQATSATVTAPAAVNIVSATTTPLTCNNSSNGVIVITANGGAAPLQYSNNNGTTFVAGNTFSGLNANTYQIIVIDANGCTQSSSAIITAPAAINIVSATPSPLTCSNTINGNIVITANGGSAPLQYSINNGTSFQAGNTFNGLNANTYQIIVRDANGCTQATSATVTAPAAINIVSATPTPLTCNNSSNGVIVITANGGVAPLQYSSNNGASFQAGNTFNGLNANTYQVIVRDANGCTLSSSAIVTAPAAINIVSSTTTPLTCNNSANGAIVITANGGAAPLQYSNNNGASFQAGNTFNGLNANTYQIIVRDANGCTRATTSNVIAPAAISLLATPASANCGNNNGSIVITAGGGSAPYQYSADSGATFQAGNTFNALFAGNYSVVIRDANGCTFSGNVIVNNTSAPVITGTPSIPVTCSGSNNGSITINANGGVAPLQYSINNGTTFQAGNTFNALTAGTYLVVVNDANGCTQSSSAIVATPSAINIASAIPSALTCSNSTNGSIVITANGGTAPLQYSINNGTTFQAGNTFNSLTASNYQIIVRDANGCTQSSSAIVTAPAAINIVSATTTPLTCNNSSNGAIVITANSGTPPLQYSINNGTTFVAGNTFNGLNANTYQIIVRDANGCTRATTSNVIAPAAISLLATPASANCGNNNGSIVITAGGGSAPYQYSADSGATFQAGNTFNALFAGNYSVVIRDANGCTLSGNVIINNTSAPVITGTPSIPVTCNGSNNGSITINANGGVAPLQYSINNGTTFQAGNTFNSLTANTYQIVVKDANGCTQTSSAIVATPSAINIASAIPSALTCSNSTNGSIVITANGGTAPLQYSINNGTTFQAGNTFNSLTASNYQIIVRDANGCTQSSSAIVTAPAAINIVSATTTPLTCNNSSNGAIVITANSGTPPLQYSINNGTTFVAGNTFNGLNANTYQIIVRDANGCTRATTSNVIAPAALSLLATPASANCGNNNGSIVITAGGGSAPYQYSADSGATFQAGNTFNALFAGNYSVVIRDANGCTLSGNVIVNNTSAPVITGTPSIPVTCSGSNNGSITINANGGVAPLQYSINNGTTFQAGNTFNALAAGTYLVVVNDANGCTATTSLNITQPTTLTSNNTTSQSTCGLNNGSILFNTNGGTLPYTYSINNGLSYQPSNTFNSLAASNYQIIIRDSNGCSLSGSVIVAGAPSPVINNIVITPILCSGFNTGSITIITSGGTAPFQYSINNGTTYQSANIFNGLAPNNYSVTVIDSNGCTTINNNNIINQPVDIQFSTTATNSNCNQSNGSITINANGGTGSLQFSIDSGISYQSSQTFNFLTAGNYNIIIRDANNCTKNVPASIVNNAAPIINNVTQNSITCNGNNNGSIIILASGGTGILQYSINNGLSFQSSSQFLNLPPGSYGIVVKDSSKCQVSSTANLAQPNVLSLSSVATPGTCGKSNGALSLSGTGGTTPYLFSIDSGNTFIAATSFSNLSASNYYVIVKDGNNCTANATVLVGNSAPPAINSIASLNPNCFNSNNGSITIAVVAGTAPITYSINNGTTFQPSNQFINLLPGNYPIIVKDNIGCLDSSNVIITQPPAMNAATVNTSSNCSNSNGAIIINASGGTGSLQYSINSGTSFQTNNQFNNLAPTSYTIVVKDSAGCLFNLNTTVNNISAPVITSSPVVNATCFGSSNGSITINAIGGSGQYLYSINGGITSQSSPQFNNLSAGNFNLVVTDTAGCSGTSSAVIISPASINVTAITAPATCGNSNGSITVNVTGGTGLLQYSINNGVTFQTGNLFNAIASSNYAVIVQDANGCTGNTNAAVNNTNAPIITSTPFQNIACFNDNNGSITINSNGGSGNLQYSINNGLTFQATNQFFNLTAATYNIIVQDSLGCQASSSVTIQQPGQILFNATATPSSCGISNGTITVNAIGGTAPFTYSSNNGTSYQPGNLFNGLNANNYIVIVKDNNGCTVSGNFAVANLNGPVISNTQPQNVSCNGANNGSIIITANGGTGSLMYSIDNGLTFQTGNIFNNLAHGNYALVVQDANGCLSTDSAMITQPLIINASYSSLNSTCSNQNGSITINASGGTGAFEYSIDNGITYQTLNLFSNINSGNYPVVVRDINGCTYALAAAVSDAPSPVIANSNVTPISCYGSNNGTLTINTTGGTSPLQYSIDNGATFQSSSLFNNLSPTSYSIVVRDSNNCLAYSSVLINQPQQINYTVSLVSANCGNNNGAISINNITGGTGSYLFSIDSGFTFSSLDQYNSLVAGNYYVIVKDSNGCTLSQLANVTNINGPIVGTLNVSEPLCNNAGNGTVSVIPGGGTGPFQYSISNGASYQAGNIFSNLLSGNYTISIKDNNGCLADSTIYIGQPDSVTFNFNTTIAACGNNNGSIVINASGGTGSAYQYSVNNGLTFQSTGSFNSLPGGNISIVVIDVNNCSAASNALISSTPDASIGINAITNNSCFGFSNGAVTLAATSGTAPFNYSINNGASWQPGASFNGLTAGIYQAWVKDGNGCLDTVTLHVAQPLQLSLAVSPNPTICKGQSTDLTVQASGGTAPYIYNWNGGFTGSIFTVNPSVNTSYNVIVTDSNGCALPQTTFNVTVRPALSLTISAADTICEGDLSTISSVASGGNGGPYTYAWTNTTFISSQVTVQPAQSTTYTVTVNDGCTVSPASAAATIVVKEKPKADFSFQPGSGCLPLKVIFTDNSVGAVAYKWTFSDGSYSTVPNPVHTYTQSGNFTVTLQVVSAYGCIDVYANPNFVKGFKTPVAMFEPTPAKTTILDPRIEFINKSTEANSWFWTFGDGVGKSELMNPAYVYRTTGQFLVTLIAETTNQCADTAYGEVIIEDAFTIYIPNSFTPNEDGKNDYFKVYGEGILNSDMQIFNRWGDVIYRDDTKSHPAWDGLTNDGSECAEGVYVYLVQATDLKGKPHQLKGTVTLVR